MSRYVINVLASQDLNRIADYFADNSVEAGEQFFQTFNRKCQQLVSFPKSGKSYVAIRPGLRGLSFRGYIISFYRLVDDRIEILRVLSDRQDFPSFFKDSDFEESD